jgi:membrane protease YdiL (CAAX protease family)
MGRVAELRASREALWAEFLGLFVVVPVATAVFLPPRAMFPVLFGFTVVGIWLLARTPGFRWTELKRGWDAVRWPVVLGFAGATLAVFRLVLEQPWLLAMIVLFYPILSALPQELIFRPLFFRRYGALLPAGGLLVANAALFSLAHLMYWSAVVAAMTFAGGLVFGWAYSHRRSFPLAVVLHSVSGWVIFTVGLGVFFYSGNVTRPF